MALFTDFFPEGGGANIDQRTDSTFAGAITGFNIGTQVAAGGQVLMLTHTTSQPSLAAMDYLRITSGAQVVTGMITAGGGTSFTVMLDAPARVVIPATTDGSVSVQEITSTGETVIVSDVVIGGGGDIYTQNGDINTQGGDLNLGDGDITTTGSVTATTFNGALNGNASTATALQNAQNFSITGDAVAAAVSFDGTGPVVLNTSLANDSVGSAEIAENAVGSSELANDAVDTAAIQDDAVNASKINADVAGEGLVQAGDGALNVNVGPGIEISSDAVQLAESVAGTGLGFTNGVLNVEALNFNNTHTYTSTSTTDATALADLVTAFNTAGTAHNGITVTVGTQFNSGDLILLTNGGTPANTESYIYVGDNRTASASSSDNTVAASNFIDITHSGDTVHSAIAGNGIAVSGATGDVTFSAVARPSSAIDVNAMGIALNSAAYGSGITAGSNGEINVIGGTNITAAADAVNLDADLTGITGVASTNQVLEINAGTAELRISGSSISDGTDTAPTFAVVQSDGHLATRTAEQIGDLVITGTAGTLPVFGEGGTGLDDSLITQTGSAALSATGGGVNVAGSGIVSVRDLGPAFGSLAANVLAGRMITFGTITQSGDSTGNIDYATLLSGNTFTITANNPTNQRVSFQTTATPDQAATLATGVIMGSISIPGAVTGVTIGAGTTISGDAVVSGTLTSGAATVTSLSAGSGAITTTGTVTGGTADINGNADISGTLTLSGLTTTTTTETRNLVVNPNGSVAVGAGSGAAGFELVVANTTGAASTVTGGDLVVLPPITTARTFALPSSPSAGTMIQISNLSATGAGSGNNLWGFTNHGGRIMGTAITDTTFELDDATASFSLVYTNATYGWVIIGAN